MSLRDTLDTIRNASAERISDDIRAVMHNATERLRASGILASMLTVGTPVPRFSLQASDGSTFNTEEQIGKGEKIFTFFRGTW